MPEYKNQNFNKGDVILQEGAVPHCAYIIKSGSVEILKKNSEGKDVPLSILKSGDIFGEMSMVDAEPRSATVRALEDVVLTIIDAPTFRDKQSALDVFSRKLVETLISRLRRQNQQLADMRNPSELMVAAKKGQIAGSKSEHTNILIKEDYRDKIDFGGVRMLFAEGNRQSKQGIKGGLHMQGFREIEDVSTVRDLRARVSQDDFDLIVVDCNLDVVHVAGVIDDIRHGKTAVSPFCIVFGIIDQPDPKTLDILSNAGLDDVLVKPIAIGNIIDRVERRIKRRKAFVVTLDYVGPDRRRNPRPGCEEIPLVDVPNPLSFRALGVPDQSTYLKQGQDALNYISDLKVERHAVQIDWLRAKIETMKSAGDDPAFFVRKLVITTKALLLKLEKREDETHIQLCGNIIDKIEGFDIHTLEMTGADWKAFGAMTARLKAELGPKE